MAFTLPAHAAPYTVLHSFNWSDGAYPFGSLIQSGSTLYGTTIRGGDTDLGTIFAFTIPEPASALLLGVVALAAMCPPRRR